MALTTNYTLIAALAALGPFATLGMQDPAMNTQIAFPKNVKESNALGQFANSILAISEISASPQSGAATGHSNCQLLPPATSSTAVKSGQYESQRLSTFNGTISFASTLPTEYSYRVQLPAVKSGQTYTIRVPGLQFRKINPVFAPMKPVQGMSASPARRITAFDTIQLAQLAGPVYDKKVSIRFTSATLQKVLDWLTSQGISFAVDNSGIATEKRVTLNAVNKRLGDVISALGEAMGGQWTERNGFLVFRKGGMAFGSTNFLPPPPQIQMSPLGSELSLPDKAINLQKLESLNLLDPKDPTVNEREMQLKMDAIASNIARINLSADVMADIAKITAEAQTLALGAIQKAATQTDADKLEKARLQAWRELRGEHVSADASVSPVNFATFLDRLTVQQVEKAHSRGYLLFSELSPVQLKLIGVDKVDQGNLTLTITKGGQTVTIKSK